MRNGTSRRWLITLYKWEGTCDTIDSFIIDRDRVRIACWQLERCPKTGRAHLQVYVVTTSPIRFSQSRKLFKDATAHVEQCNGDRYSCIKYCTKEKTRAAGPWWFPSKDECLLHRQGRRNDLEQVAQDIRRSGLHRTALQVPAVYIRYHRGMEAYANLLATENFGGVFRNVKVYILWGQPGTGKTRAAYSLYGKSLYRLASCQPEWWDGYTGQKTVLLDDFYGCLPYARMLHLLDGYPLQLPRKGSFWQASYKRVVITSNTSYKDWYPNVFTNETRLRAFRRRIHKIIHFDSL